MLNHKSHKRKQKFADAFSSRFIFYDSDVSITYGETFMNFCDFCGSKKLKTKVVSNRRNKSK